MISKNGAKSAGHSASKHGDDEPAIHKQALPLQPPLVAGLFVSSTLL